ncbi:MAG: hypothetical protein ABI947_06625 [Chloroflexota bacterium]
MDTIEDDYFGLLKWDTRFLEWEGYATLRSDEEVGINLPPEYIDSDEVRKHIQETMKVIERDELSFRQQAANELFTEGGYGLFWDDDQEFDHGQFVNEMHLVSISFAPDFPKNPLTLELDYEYGEGVEHGISIYLTWDGVYRDAR